MWVNDVICEETTTDSCGLACEAVWFNLRMHGERARACLDGRVLNYFDDLCSFGVNRLDKCQGSAS